MGKISKGVNQNQLDTAKIWYFTEENTIEANNHIRLLAKLVLQEGKAPRVRGLSAEENPVLT